MTPKKNTKRVENIDTIVQNYNDNLDLKRHDYLMVGGMNLKVSIIFLLRVLTLL